VRLHLWYSRRTGCTRSIRMRFPIILPQKLQVSVLMRFEAGMQLGEIDPRPELRRCSQRPRRKQKLIQPLFIEFSGNASQPRCCRLLQISMTVPWPIGATAGDLVLVQPQAKP